MKYIRKFTTKTDYANSKVTKDSANPTFFEPCISMVANETVYDPMPFNFSPRYLYSDLTAGTTVSNSVIGVEVIPASHTKDGKARWMSVKNMSKNDPENGTTATGNDNNNPGAGIVWGKANDDVPGLLNRSSAGHSLKFDTQAEITAINPYGLENILTSSNSRYLATDYDNGQDNNQYPFAEGVYLTGFGISAGSMIKDGTIPYPFDKFGNSNPLYTDSTVSSTAVGDMNGAENTMILVNRIAVEGWETSQTLINDVSGAINHPAAAACYRFNAGVNSLSHKWYLPSAGELGYIMASIAKLNSKLSALSTNGVCLGCLNDSTYSTSTLGDFLWSSSEYGSDNSWCLNLYSGTLGTNDYKDSTGTSLRVRAFIVA